MTIASEITRINNNIASAYTAVSNKGGTLPATQNLSNLPTAISSIPSGGESSNLTNLYCWSITEPTSSFYRNKLVYTASSTPNIGDNAIVIVTVNTVDGISVTGVISSSSISVDYGICQRNDKKDILFN